MQNQTLKLSPKTKSRLNQNKLIKFQKPTAYISPDHNGNNKRKDKKKTQIGQTKHARREAAYEYAKSLNLKRPFAIGISIQLRMLFKRQGFGRSCLNSALHRLTSSEDYLRAVIDGTVRYNVDGSQAQPILDEHKSFAMIALHKLNMSNAEKE